MTLKIALQIDPLSRLSPQTDSSLALGREACLRGYELFYYTPDKLSLLNGELTAHVTPLTLFPEDKTTFETGPSFPLSLNDLDVLFIRQDPPFDLAYLTNLYLLEHITKSCFIVNHPRAIYQAPEKLLVTHFPTLTPETLITREKSDILSFWDKHKKIILKPLYGNGGAGVFFLDQQDKNFDSLHELFLERSKEPYIVQQYLPEIRQGDKRVLLIDGKPVGAVNRRPPNDQTRANFHVGGRAEACALTDRDIEICDKIGPYLKENGLFFVGIDIIGSYLTEINVTSPTGILEINHLNQTSIEKIFWNTLEAKITQKKGG